MASEKGAEQPLEKFTRFKYTPGAWDKEMDDWGLSEEQKALLHKYLDYESGIAAAQEDIMRMIQDPQLGGWSLAGADKLRKSIAKKNKQLYEELTAEYFKTVEDKHLDKTLCEYFWKVLVNTQRGYSFNLSHCLSYALICLQEMNLATQFPTIFWNTANLIVDAAGADDDSIEEEKEEIEAQEVEEPEIVSIFEEEDSDFYEYEDLPGRKEKVKRVKKTINYGKTGAAIGKFKNWGIDVMPPDINTSDFTFSPDVDKNVIVYGLRGIANISPDLIKLIMSNRPYKSFEEFYNKVNTTKPQMVNLIKSGSFDTLEPDRKALLIKYIGLVTPKAKSVDLRSMKKMLAQNLIPSEFEREIKIWHFNEYLKTTETVNGEYALIPQAIDFMAENFDKCDSTISLPVWKKLYDKAMDPVRIYVKQHKAELLAAFDSYAKQELMDKYGQGSLSKWEMQSLTFYNHPHELVEAGVVLGDFFSMPETPQPMNQVYVKSTNSYIPIYDLQLIAGTVIDKNKTKGLVTVLTPTGVVNVKVYKNQFAGYDKQISEPKPEGGKRVIEKSWFTRGNLLMFQGIRRENDFILKKYKSSVYPVITKINIDNDGRVQYIYERAEVSE